MLPAVELDYYFSVKADKIDNISPDGLLSSELRALNLPVSQLAPEKPFGFGRIMT
jgi:hypothetical protein